MTNGNGNGNGHVLTGAAAQTREITLPDSGAVLRVRGVSPMSLIAIEQAYPDPKPPLQDVAYELGHRMERNPLDPEYVAELAAHQQKKSLLVFKAFVRLGVEVEIDAERVAAYRADMAALEVTLDPDDLFIYVGHLLCRTNADMLALQTAIQGLSVPTEQAVADKQATFPSGVPGA